jgi:serine/threonine-protein kinase RsbW
VSSPAAQPGPSLRRVDRADSRALVAFRAALSTWLDDVFALTAERRADIVLAVDEALTNCTEHAYTRQDDPGSMTLDATTDGDSLRVCVSDEGTWTEPEPRGTRCARGRGLRLMERLVDELIIDGQPGGTVVRMSFFECPPRNPADTVDSERHAN